MRRRKRRRSKWKLEEGGKKRRRKWGVRDRIGRKNLKSGRQGDEKRLSEGRQKSGE